MKSNIKSFTLFAALGLGILSLSYWVLMPVVFRSKPMAYNTKVLSMEDTEKTNGDSLLGTVFVKNESLRKIAKPQNDRVDGTNNSAPRSYAELIATEKELASKVLRSRFEQDELNAILSDLGSLTYARSQLNETVSEKNRMRAVEFLVHSLRWKQNPRRQEVIDLISEFLNSDSPKSNAPPDQKKSLVADKIELFVNLYQQAPGDAKKLLKDESTTELNSKVFHFAYNFYLKK